MKTLQSQLFIGVRVLYLLLVVIMMIGIPGGGSSFISILLQGIVGVALAYLIVKNYEKGKNWARIWMLIALYLSIALYFRDVYEFTRLTGFPGFGGWGVLGIIVDVACVAGSAVAAIRVHRAGVLGIEGVSGSPETASIAPSAEPEAQNAPDSQWTCPKCAHKNPVNLSRCDRCGYSTYRDSP